MELKDALEVIREVVQDALEKESLLDDQKEYIWNSILPNKDVILALARYAYETCCSGELYIARNRLKKGIIDQKQYQKETRRTLSIMAAMTAPLENFYCGEKPIGDCDVVEIISQAEYHRSKGDAEYLRANIFQAVANKVKPGKIARQCLSNSQFNRIIKNITGKQTKKAG